MKRLSPLKKPKKKGKGNRGISQTSPSSSSNILSWVQLLTRVKQKRSKQGKYSMKTTLKTTFQEFKNSNKKKKVEPFVEKIPLTPLIIPNKKKNQLLILTEKYFVDDIPQVLMYNKRIVDFKNNRLLQRYIGLGGQILPRRQTSLTAKEQRALAKNIKRARMFSLLPFVNKEKGYFR